MDSASAPSRELPILKLGITGFTLDERERIESVLAALPAGWTPWRLVPFVEADAWWVSGSRTQVMPDGSLRVEAGHVGEVTLGLKLTQVDRPVAFSTPIVADAFTPRCVFGLDDVAGMHSALHMFGTWLQHLHAQFVLAAMVARRAAELRQSVHHLQFKGTLLAVLDYRDGNVGILPSAQPAELWAAEWVRRPPTAHSMPRNFIRYMPAELLWAYVRRTDRDLLPERYRQDRIYYRHQPHVPPELMRPSHFLIMRTLAEEPGNFKQLRKRTGMADDELAYELSLLYYAGSITTTHAKAAPRGSGGPISTPPSLPPSGVFDSSHFSPSGPGDMLPPDDFVPPYLRG